ncbi:cytochrome p450 oxidoreductase [Purpureocillium lavendulum]|uniref:Cytochrome p450 oxidoreductase n=1 Tax=Purpureocillium lavendulum TaxID=1247861 RepID=A0AB34FST6_9HYPO|nr:cytochrome p450 oxidoreductase [Purpureocillium lavendulum]
MSLEIPADQPTELISYGVPLTGGHRDGPPLRASAPRERRLGRSRNLSRRASFELKTFAAPHRPAMDEKSKLVAYVARSLSEEEDFHFLRFEFLQRLNIVNLQVRLARRKSRIQRDGEAEADELEGLTTELQQYGETTPAASVPHRTPPAAIRDYQFLRNKKSVKRDEVPHRKLLLQRFFQSESEDFGDPFESHYSYFDDADGKADALRRAMMKYLPAQLAFSRQERHERGREYTEGKPPRVLSALVDRLVRFLIAFTGGVFLVVPMIIMTLHPSQTKSLVTVSVAVLVFSLMLSFVVRVSNVETLVSTATYAAVLVARGVLSAGDLAADALDDVAAPAADEPAVVHGPQEHRKVGHKHQRCRVSAPQRRHKAVLYAVQPAKYKLAVLRAVVRAVHAPAVHGRVYRRQAAQGVEADVHVVAGGGRHNVAQVVQRRLPVDAGEAVAGELGPLGLACVRGAQGRQEAREERGRVDRLVDQAHPFDEREPGRAVVEVADEDVGGARRPGGKGAVAYQHRRHVERLAAVVAEAGQGPREPGQTRSGMPFRQGQIRARPMPPSQMGEVIAGHGEQQVQDVVVVKGQPGDVAGPEPGNRIVVGVGARQRLRRAGGEVMQELKVGHVEGTRRGWRCRGWRCRG